MRGEQDLIGRWGADARTRGLAPVSIDTYRWAMLDFRKFAVARGCEIEDADRIVLRAYIDNCRSKGLTTKSISGRLAALSSFFDFLSFEGVREDNPVLAIRKRYLSAYKTDGERQTHQLVSVEDAARMVRFHPDSRDQAMLLLLFKTGVRRGELLSMETGDINWQNQSILLKPKKKRSNRVVFFDDETAYVLQSWLDSRLTRGPMDSALWISSWGKKVDYGALAYVTLKASLHLGLHHPESPRMEDHFSAHCCRHWFSTHLFRAGMEERYISWLRGDAPKGSIGQYIHIDPEDVRRSYLAHIPQLGI